MGEAGPTRGGGKGGQWPPGPMEFRGPKRGPMSSRGGPSKWHWEVKGPSKSHVNRLICFGDHLISAGKTVKISEKTFFVWRSHHFSDQTAAFSPSILDFTKPQFRHVWAGPGPKFGSRRPWGKDRQLDDLDLDWPITLRILDGIAWDFTQAKWWMWLMTLKSGCVISSCCPPTLTEKRAMKKEKENKHSL